MAFVICFICLCVSGFCVEKYVSAITVKANELNGVNKDDISNVSIRFYKLFAQGFAVTALILANV